MAARADTLLYLEDELPGAQAWAARRGAPLTWDTESFELRVTLTQPESEEPFYLRGVFDDYRELPPAWTFTNDTWTAPPSPALFPKVTHTPYGAPIFIVGGRGPIICAPFNRLAYAVHGGPHGDWTLGAWLTAGQDGQVRATCVGDMLQIMYRDLMLSRERMG